MSPSVIPPPSRLPLHARHASLGARFAEFAGWSMPLQYLGVIAEHAAVRAAAGVFDVSHMGRCMVSGGEVSARLRSATTFDVTALAPGKAHYSLYCNRDGGIDDDVFVYRLDGRRWMVVHNAANASAGFERLVNAAGSVVEDIGRETVMLAIQGPSALGLLRRILGRLPEALPPRSCTEVQWERTKVFVGRTGYTGEDGAECVADIATGERLWDAMVQLGAQPCGLGARDTLRMEAALPLYGHELDSGTDPYAAGLGWAVTMNDGAGFIGRPALLERIASPASTHLAHLMTNTREVPRQGCTVFDANGTAALGTVTSGTFGPSLGRGLAMAYLPKDVAAGAEVLIGIRNKRVAATVVKRPFYRRAS